MDVRILFLHGTKAVCPACSGLVTKRKDFYVCSDCGAVYEYKGPGPAEEKEIYVSRIACQAPAAT